jgi:hypothetical protein
MAYFSQKMEDALGVFKATWGFLGRCWMGVQKQDGMRVFQKERVALTGGAKTGSDDYKAERGSLPGLHGMGHMVEGSFFWKLTTPLEEGCGSLDPHKV